MKKLDKSDWIAILLVLVVVNIISLWCIDISISAMSVPELCKSELTNGFVVKDPMKMYHIGLYVCIMTLILISFITIRFIIGDFRNVSNN